MTYFYVTIPNQPVVKLKYDPKAPGASGQYTWTGTWNVPAAYPKGVVDIKVLVKSKAKRHGSFVQVPVVTSQLTISTNPQLPAGNGPAPVSTAPTGKVTTVLYADSVNGTRPAGAAPRPVGCTQTNVYKRGEQFVLRTWGFDLTSGDVLSTDNVDGGALLDRRPAERCPELGLARHPAEGRSSGRTPGRSRPSYPLGDSIVHVSFTLTSGKVATLDYPITITP